MSRWLLFLLIFAGCSVRFRHNPQAPTDPKDLAIFIAEQEERIKGLEAELDEKKASRDALGKSKLPATLSENGTDWYIERQNREIEFQSQVITHAKAELAKAKALEKREAAQ